MPISLLKFVSTSTELGILSVGVALAIGLRVLTMDDAVGHISVGHFDPAVFFGLFADGRFSAKELLPYIVGQCVGAIATAGALSFINAGVGDGRARVFATNFYEVAVYFEKSYSMQQAFMTEFSLTCYFLIIIMGAPDKYANGKFVGIASGLGLILIPLMSIPITNTSVAPARSLSQVVFVGRQALSQLRLFWVAPVVGAIVAGAIYKSLLQRTDEEVANA